MLNHIQTPYPSVYHCYTGCSTSHTQNASLVISFQIKLVQHTDHLATFYSVLNGNWKDITLQIPSVAL